MLIYMKSKKGFDTFVEMIICKKIENPLIHLLEAYGEIRLRITAQEGYTVLQLLNCLCISSLIFLGKLIDTKYLYKAAITYSCRFIYYQLIRSIQVIFSCVYFCLN